MVRSRFLGPVLAVALAAAGIVFLTRSHETRSTSTNGIRVVASNGAAANAGEMQTLADARIDGPEPTTAPTPAKAITANDPPADLDPSERAAMMPRQFRTEPRDPSWAPTAEKTLQHAYAGIPYLAADAPMTVRCASAICEISGGIDPAATPDNQNIAMQQLQGRRATDDFSEGSAIFGPVPGQSKGGGYRLYLKRR